VKLSRTSRLLVCSFLGVDQIPAIANVSMPLRVHQNLPHSNDELISKNARTAVAAAVCSQICPSIKRTSHFAG
jgi:hypothetical protein